MLKKLFAQKRQWKLINFRTVSNFLTAEFLHDLYNRHAYEVNSIRFRNTLCVLNGNSFKSFAPLNEWQLLETELGERFYNRDPILMSELSLYIDKDKKRLKGLLASMPTDFSSYSPEEVYKLLVHLHYVSLGEIYGINLVQVEHAISWAIAHYTKGKTDFSNVPVFSWESQQRKMEKALLDASIELSEKKVCFETIYPYLAEEYGDFGCGYGTGVDFRDELKTQLLELACLPLEVRKARLKGLSHEAYAVPSSYQDLYEMASRVGELRDKNKLLMGKVTGVKNGIVEHLSQALRTDLNWYSLSEIGQLVRHNEKLSIDEIEERQKLLIFKREEGFCSGDRSEGIYRTLLADLNNSGFLGTAFKGVVASKGNVTGFARLVFTAQDCETIKNGEIMVAHGTDFDLLSGINKAAGIVTEEGGILSHASIVSRELEKPCLIGVQGAVGAISNGDLIRLDCEKGTLHILEMSGEEKLPCIRRLEEIDPKETPSKMANLHLLKKQGYPVLPGLCIESTPRHLNSTFFEVLKNKIRSSLCTDKVIIRQCLALEDQKDKSYAGSSCSRVASTDLQTLTKVFHDLVDDFPMEMLIQPFIPFDMGGVTFIQTDSLGRKFAVVEYSEKGPFEAVHGIEVQRCSLLLTDAHHLESSVIREVLKIAEQIVSDKGFDVDIEWGYWENKVWILQVRPVTAACAV